MKTTTLAVCALLTALSTSVVIPAAYAKVSGKGIEHYQNADTKSHGHIGDNTHKSDTHVEK